jgi:lipoprotein NlpD
MLVAACASRPTSAPVVDHGTSPAAKSSTTAGMARGTHVVKQGETLYSIALEHGVDYRELARWNGLNDASRIRVGQSLQLSPSSAGTQAGATAAKGVEIGNAREKGGVETRPLDSGTLAAQGGGDGSTKTSPKALRLPYSKENVAMLSGGPGATPSTVTSTPTSTVATTAAQPAPTAPQGALGFVWPAKGKVLNGFAEPNSKGVDIGGQPGDPVVAAAAGRVMYTGTGIRGYGKLIVIKHEDGYNSVYAHNRSILVKEGQSVARGERIAELGATDSDRPKLHFEIRKSGKPVDPMKYLPQPRS